MRNQIRPHTLERARERGAGVVQIEDVLRTGIPVPAGGGRLAKSKVYDYDSEWKGRHYDQQMVKVIYLVEGDLLTTVTVVVYYGRWREDR